MVEQKSKPQTSLLEILTNAYFLGENEKDIDVVEFVDQLKQQLMVIVNMKSED